MNCLVQAIEKFEVENYRISAENCRKNALRFAPIHFQSALKLCVQENWSQFKMQLKGSEVGEDVGVTIAANKR